jgi:hypothetical protein
MTFKSQRWDVTYLLRMAQNLILIERQVKRPRHVNFIYSVETGEQATI